MVKISVGNLIVGILFIIGYIVLCFTLKTGTINYKKFYNLVFIAIEVVCISVFTVGNATLHNKIKTDYTEEEYYSSDAYMYDSFVSNYASLQKFGYYGFYFEDFFRYLIPSTKPTLKTFDYDYEYYSSVLNNLCADNNVIMIYGESFDNLAISKELTPTLYALKNGANLSTIGIKNFYTVSKVNGKTTISRKDFDYNGTNYTFNGTDIYDGLTFEKVGLRLANHQSKETTNYSELKALTGNCQDFNHSLPKILEDYNSFYIHGNTNSFYHRNEYIESGLKFKNSAFLENIRDITVGNFNTLNCCTMDSETIRYFIDNPESYNCFPTDEKFFTFMMTITTHKPYTYTPILEDNYKFVDAVSNSSIEKKLFEIYNSLDENDKETIKEYYARVLDTEYAVSYIVNHLQETDMLDKTIITLAGDHEPPMETTKTHFIDKYNLTASEKLSYHSIEGFIYSTNITSSYLESHGESRVITHKTESVDLAPTILTLLGRDFEQDIYMGTAVINKSLTDPTKTVYDKLMRSYFYGYVESDTLKSIDGQTIKSKDSNYTPSQEEIDEFVKEYNNLFKKFYYVQSKR